MANHRKLTREGKLLCSKCRRWLPVEFFYESEKYSSGRIPSCKSCEEIRRKKRNASEEGKKWHREWAKSYRKTPGGKKYLAIHDVKKHLRGKYGMSLDEYEQMLHSQNGVCAICGQPPKEQNTTKKSGITYVLRRLVVDHDHETDSVRGLLCRSCNSGIGLFGDSIGFMKKAIEYLESFNSTKGR